MHFAIFIIWFRIFSPFYIYLTLPYPHKKNRREIRSPHHLGVRIPATSYLVPLFTLIYLVLFHLLPPYHLDVPCYLNNRQRYCSVWSERLGLFTLGLLLFHCDCV